MPQLEEVLKRRVPIVTTTEEAAYPAAHNRRLARRIDEAARKAKVAILGTGVNPGFTMDALPIALTAVCERVDSVEVHRVQDARVRRLPFQQKIGAGLTLEQFRRKVDEGSVRHVGFAESIQMIADALGWKLDKITDDVKPVVADGTVQSELLAVDAGYVSGIIQVGNRLRRRRTAHQAAHGGVPRRAGIVRFGHDRGLTTDPFEGRGRCARRHRHRGGHGQLDSGSAGRRARAAHHARCASAVVLRRSREEAFLS